ncbi:MAG: phosphatidylglycerol lysyltransferase domain-containing protein [Candidatus Thermoplasmatota archaeon]
MPRDPIPPYPKFAPLGLCHRAEILQYLRREQPEVSELSFGSIYCWRSGYHPFGSIMGSLLILKVRLPNNTMCYGPPIGDGDKVMAVERLFADGCTHIAGVTEPLLNALREHGFSAEPDRDNWDYVYRVEDLAHLEGTKYHRRRKDVRRFEESARAEYRAMSEEHIEECKRLAEEWCKQMDCEEHESLRFEKDAILCALENLRALDLFGGVALADRKICALTIAEHLRDGMAVTHFEKADPFVTGAYQYINREFAAHALSSYDWVNREQDLGIQGLRKNKMSYHPHHMVEKHVITLQGSRSER